MGATLTGMEFSSAFYQTSILVTSHGFEGLFYVTLSHQGIARRPKPIEQGVTIFTIHKLNYCSYYFFMTARFTLDSIELWHIHCINLKPADVEQ